MNASADQLQTQYLIPQPRQVHTITDRFSMTNTYLLIEDRVVVVDPGSELNVRLLCDYLHRFLGRTSLDIDLIVLTHLHPDHTGGVEALQRLCNAPVAASIAAQSLAQIEKPEGRALPRVTHFVGQVLPGTLHHLDLFPPAYAQQIKMVNIWLEDVSGLPSHPSWRIIASPGHTLESLCLYNPFTRELLCGDTVLTIEGRTPLLRNGTNRHQLEETLQVLRTLQIQYLYPGHGRPILSFNPLKNIEVEW